MDVDQTLIFRPDQITSATQSITYNYETSTPTGSTLSYIKKITTLNSFWQRVIYQRIGKDADVNPHRIIIAFQNVRTPAAVDADCQNVVMVYPSFAVKNVKNACGGENMESYLNKSRLW